MTPFQTLTGGALPLMRDNIDTDAIMPSREIKSVSKRGLAPGLFAGWRYQGSSRTPNPQFELNDPAYGDAVILLCGENFGCGSSREHAVWALLEYGFRAIVAPSFAPIFFVNCINNGLLPAVLPAQAVRALAERVARAPRATALTVDLEECVIRVEGAEATPFAIPPDARARLLEGLDAIDLTMRGSAALDAFQARDREARPWVYLEEGS
jgi:3-isopropylmalate/(R)-2-methylmalate dehydratase small subunit